MPGSAQDERWMRAALGLAASALGTVSPNPAVACLLVKDEAVVGRGRTQPGGRPHAETVALAQAGADAKGATAYVTLEPCSHWGRTPPCAEGLVEAGIARAVVACPDPDPRVAGRGLERMRQAGIEVTAGVLEAEAHEINAGFFSRIERGRPLVTLKTATSLDGRIATSGGESQWITGEVARAHGHGLRATHDAILVGSGTVGADDPELNCRLAGLGERSPIRVVVDGRLMLPLTSRLVKSARARPTWAFTLQGSDAARRRVLEDCGVEVVEVAPDGDQRPDLCAVFQELGRRGLTRVLVEAGSRLAGALLRADLVDRIAWFRSGTVVGGDGLAAISGFGVERLARAPRFERDSVRPLGPDVLETYRRSAEA